MARWNRTVPLDRRGNLMHAADGWRVAEWRPVSVFASRLRFVGSPREIVDVDENAGIWATRFPGIWATRFPSFQDGEGHTYPIFHSDFSDVVRTCTLRNGWVEAWWTFVKRGSCFGIKMVPPPQPLDPAEPDRSTIEALQMVCGLLTVGGRRPAKDFCEERGWQFDAVLDGMGRSRVVIAPSLFPARWELQFATGTSQPDEDFLAAPLLPKRPRRRRTR